MLSPKMLMNHKRYHDSYKALIMYSIKQDKKQCFDRDVCLLFIPINLYYITDDQ